MTHLSGISHTCHFFGRLLWEEPTRPALEKWELMPPALYVTKRGAPQTVRTRKRCPSWNSSRSAHFRTVTLSAESLKVLVYMQVVTSVVIQIQTAPSALFVLIHLGYFSMSAREIVSDKWTIGEGASGSWGAVLRAACPFHSYSCPARFTVHGPPMMQTYLPGYSGLPMEIKL